MNELMSNSLVNQIKSLLEASRQKIAVEVNTTLLHTYWQIGKVIIEDEQLHSDDFEYEKKVLAPAFKSAYNRVWQRLFPFQSFQHAIVLFDSQRCPDGVWTVIVVALLRASSNFRRTKT